MNDGMNLRVELKFNAQNCPTPRLPVMIAGDGVLHDIFTGEKYL